MSDESSDGPWWKALAAIVIAVATALAESLKDTSTK